LSKETQNDLIEKCGIVIQEKIVSEIKVSRFFSILADEAMDISGKEQLSFVIRYVDSSHNIREDFLGFVHLKEGLTGKNLSDAILKKVNDLGLSINDCRGQGYDGAGSVAGDKNGCAAHIRRVNHKALYTHCFSHRLNLAVSSTCKITSVTNMFEQVRKISEFFKYSEQRQRVFEEFVAQFNPDSSKVKLKDVCKTRWIERIDGLQMFVSLFPSIWHCLDDMKMNISGRYNNLTKTNAFSFFKAIDDFDFIVNLVMVYRVFDVTLDATILLQSKKNDIADGIKLIHSLLHLVNEFRRNIDEKHEAWYGEALKIAKDLNIPEKKLRTNKRQVHRENHPSSNVSEYYKLSLTIPLLDHVVGQLTSRFSEQSLVSYYGLYLLPSKIVSMNTEKNSGASVKPLSELVTPFYQFYKDDLPFSDHFFQELKIWQDVCLKRTDNVTSNITSTLKEFKFSGLENIKVCLKILGTLPITSCECERSFSGMRRLKNYLRNSMVEERLNGLAMMEFHQNFIPDSDTVINKFAGDKNRRLAFNI